MDQKICLINGQVSHKSLFLQEKLPDGHMWSGVRLTKRLATSRPDHLWPEIWENYVKELQHEGKAKLGK